MTRSIAPLDLFFKSYLNALRTLYFQKLAFKAAIVYDFLRKYLKQRGDYYEVFTIVTIGTFNFGDVGR